MKTRVRSQRWRRTFVGACLPYLLLSVFVDFIHLHQPVQGDDPQVSVSAHGATPETHKTPLPGAPCAVCLWIQSGTGLQVPVSTEQPAVIVTDALPPLPEVDPVRPALLSPDFRGPPLSLFS